MNTDPRELLARSPMARLQVIVVALTVALNALNGFGVLSISFASPGIAAEWGVDPGRLGLVLSMELIGMSIGSVLIGGVADTWGRRPTMLLCLTVMAVGMLLSTTAGSVAEMSAWRVLTGLGIGGMLAVITAVVAEFANARRKALCVSLMAIGYPIGAVLGGTVIAPMLDDQGWRAVFWFGAAVTAAFLPLIYVLVPESVHWLTRKQPDGALERVNAALRRMGQTAVVSLPTIAENVRRRSVGDLFAPALVLTTVLVTLAYFFHITTFYFIIKWVPSIVSDMGFAASDAARVLVWANVGGALGGAVFGLVTMRVGVKPLTIGVMLLSMVMVSAFGRAPADLAMLSVIAAVAGFCTNAGVVGMYAIFAQAFPTHVRATGTGFAIGVGRAGSVLAPIIAGLLFAFGAGLPGVAMVMGAGSLLAALMIVFLKLRPDLPGGEGAVEPTADNAADAVSGDAAPARS